MVAAKTRWHAMRSRVHQSARLRQDGHAMRDQIANANGANRATVHTMIVGASQSVDESGWIISTKIKLHVAHKHGAHNSSDFSKQLQRITARNLGGERGQSRTEQSFEFVAVYSEGGMTIRPFCIAGPTS